MCCVAGRSAAAPTSAGPLTAAAGLPRAPTTSAVSGWRGLNTFEPSAPFSFPLFPSFRPSVPHGEAVEIFLVAGSWLTRPFVARKAVATGLLKRLWRLERTAVEDLAGDSPAVGVLGMPPPRADPLRNLRLRHPPRRHPLPPPRQPSLKPPQVPPRQPPVAPKQLEPQERNPLGDSIDSHKSQREAFDGCAVADSRTERKKDGRKRREGKRGKRAQSYSALASRTPQLLLVNAGGPRMRKADRQSLALLENAPPRSTRDTIGFLVNWSSGWQR